jgi:hypothetical protein
MVGCWVFQASFSLAAQNPRPGKPRVVDVCATNVAVEPKWASHARGINCLAMKVE